jgi:hypothetical protein
VPFKFEEISEKVDIPDKCKQCNEELEEIYWRHDPIYELAVLECPKCKTIYAYLIEIENDSMVSWDSEGDPLNEHSTPKTTDLKKAIPKNCISAYSKALSSQESKNSALSKIINAKLPDLYKLGLSLTTINLARSALTSEINDNTTKKQLTILIAASIYAKANTVTGDVSWEHRGEGATERQLEEIFGVSRKTIRKWAERFVGKRMKGATL